MKTTTRFLLTLMLAGAMALATGAASADEPGLQAADSDRPAGMSTQDWADLQYSATLDRDDLYEDEAVTKEEFAAQVAALDVAMAETIREKATIVYPGEE